MGWGKSVVDGWWWWMVYGGGFSTLYTKCLHFLGWISRALLVSWCGASWVEMAVSPEATAYYIAITLLRSTALASLSFES